MTGWSELQRVDAGRLPHGSHRLKAGKLQDVSDQFRVVDLDVEAHRVVDRFGIDTVELHLVRAGDRTAIRFCQMAFLDCKSHRHV